MPPSRGENISNNFNVRKGKECMKFSFNRTLIRTLFSTIFKAQRIL